MPPFLLFTYVCGGLGSVTTQPFGNFHGDIVFLNRKEFCCEEVELTLVHVCGFWVCEFTCQLVLIGSPEAAPEGFCRPDARVSSWCLMKPCSAFCNSFHSRGVNTCPSKSVQCPVSHLFMHLVISLFKTAPECSAEAPSSVVGYQKAVMCLKEKTDVLGRLHSGMTVLLAMGFMLMNQQCVLDQCL